MTIDDVLAEFKAAGALARPFRAVLRPAQPGLPAEVLVFMHAARTERLCKALAAKITAGGRRGSSGRLAGRRRHHPGL